nr:putative retrotransposon Ty1-copia subclass protein [Tanacetum cinerariifolium]
MVLTKKVDKTPYELWYGKVPNLSYLKVWRCEALVKQDIPNRLQQRSVKCIFIGYPKETMGYYFYFPPENKIVVARYAEFFEKNLIAQERFKEKTDMDGVVHTYKARLVAKGYTQFYGVDYEETFLPVADIRAIRILISVAALYDYEIWQMHVKTAFLNGYLDEDIYMDYLGKCFAMKDLGKRHLFLESKSTEIGEPHWTVVKTILKYLRDTKDTFLVYGRNPEAKLTVDCYCNAGFETDIDDMKS